MTGELPFQMFGCPGPNAVPTIEMDQAGHRHLALFLDPVSLVITVPPFPDGPFVLARFYRRLARLALQLAAELDPNDSQATPGTPGRAGASGAHRRRDGGGVG